MFQFSRRFVRLTLALLVAVGNPLEGATTGENLHVEVYATAHQVTDLCADRSARQEVIEELRSIAADKIYLEAYRGGHWVDGDILVEARKHFEEEGFEVATGITTTPGSGGGQASNNNRNFFNYEAESTRALIKELFEFMAERFDEILVDDFFLTDDTSEVSAKAKGDRSWSEYRLDLMTEISRDWAVEPAKAANPKVSISLKYPQWYEKFHLYGYDVVRQPEIFDRIWVGTETRNPDTQRFGFAQPTMGAMNFRWLSSMSGEKVQGAWFDPLDGREDVYLMQAYQSVLAGAKHLTLFNLGEYTSDNPVLAKFRERREAVTQLAEVIGDARPLGIAAYRPPNRDPGRDEYLFDFLAVLGLPILPTGRLDDLEGGEGVLLGAHAKGAEGLLKKLLPMAEDGPPLTWTPGYAPDHVLEETVDSSEIRVGDVDLRTDRSFEFLKIHPPKEAEILASTTGGEEETPILMKDRTTGGLNGRLLNVFTFTQEDYDAVGEMFLPPKPLGISEWPRVLADRVREISVSDLPLSISADPPFGLNVYEDGIVVVSNFTDEVREARVQPKEGAYRLHPGFGHAEGVSLEGPREGRQTLRIPGWEVAVLQMRTTHEPTGGNEN